MADPRAGGAAVALVRRNRGWAVADLEVKLDPNDVARIQRMLSYVPKSIPQVFSTALNRTATTARKESAQKISAASGMKVNIVRNMIFLQKATRTQWFSVLRFKSAFINAIKFFKSRTRDGKTKFTNPGNVKLWVKGGGEPQSPFIQTMPGGFTGVFDRVGFARLPIRQVFGPTLSELFEGSAGIINDVQRNARTNLARNVEGQVKRVLAKGA
jgi:hypothetical protein